MTIPEWEALGIPEGYGPHRLVYNPPSETVIVELRSVGEEFLPNRIYIRHKDFAKYELIQVPEPMVSHESVLTSLGRPFLFFNTIRLSKCEMGYGGDWGGIYSFDIQKRTLLQLASKDSLLLPPPYSEGWVSGLVSASEDASRLYLTVGMMMPENSSSFRMVGFQSPSVLS